METLVLKCGTETESLLQFIVNNLTVEQIDSIEIEREYDDIPGIGGEPLTTSIILALTPIITIQVSRIIERWLEIKNQQTQLKLTLEALALSEESGKVVAKIVTNNANVSVGRGLTNKKDVE